MAASWDPAVARIVEEARIPGAAVAVVERGRSTVRTYGRRSCDGGGRVGPRTAFDLGSCSKSYVATAVAMLVGDGKLSFDEPVQRHLPEMEFDEARVTREATVRDLLSNRLGLKRQIPVESFANPGVPALEIMRRVRGLDRLHPFRRGYVYFNPGFMACRLIVERVSGLSYGEFLDRRLFAPLGMRHSASGSAQAARLADRAQGHVYRKGTAQPADSTAFDNWQGAAGIWSCGEDAARWLGFLLAGGAPLVDPAVLAETWRAHTQIPAAERKLIHGPPGTPEVAYCLGWWTLPFHGRRLVQHAGEMFGWRAHHAVLPEAGIGVSVMLSMAVPRHAAIAYAVLECLLGVAGPDWCEVADRMQAEQDAAVRRLLEAAFPASSAPMLEPGRYAGIYSHPACGRARVRARGDGLELSLLDGRVWDLDLQPLGGHVFEGSVRNPSFQDYAPAGIRLRFRVEGGEPVALSDPNATWRREA